MTTALAPLSLALFAFTSAPIIGTDQVVAWQAHIGGFLAGLIAFAAFDPVPKARRGE